MPLLHRLSTDHKNQQRIMKSEEEKKLWKSEIKDSDEKSPMFSAH